MSHASIVFKVLCGWGVGLGAYFLAVAHQRDMAGDPLRIVDVISLGLALVVAGVIGLVLL